jgi:hypothetical protein
LILSFDDVVTIYGYRDSVTPNQLEAYLEMESTDEKIHKKMRMVRELETKEKAKQHQKEIQKKRRKAVAEGKDPDENEGGFKSSSASKPDDIPESKPVEKPKPKPFKPTKNRGMALGSTAGVSKSDFAKPVFDFGDPEELIPDEPEEEAQEYNALTENLII